QLGKRALHNDKAAVFGRQLISDPDCLRVLVEAEQSSPLRQLLEDGSTVPSAPEGAIYIKALRANRQALQRFVQQYTDMFQFGLLIHRLNKCSSAGSSPTSCSSSR